MWFTVAGSVGMDVPLLLGSRDSSDDYSSDGSSSVCLTGSSPGRLLLDRVLTFETGVATTVAFGALGCAVLAMGAGVWATTFALDKVYLNFSALKVGA